AAAESLDRRAGQYFSVDHRSAAGEYLRIARLQDRLGGEGAQHLARRVRRAGRRRESRTGRLGLAERKEFLAAKARLGDRTVEKPPRRRRGHERIDRRAAGRFAENRHLFRIAAE